jgi:hypothetical protein
MAPLASSDSDSGSRMSHQINEDSDQDVGKSNAYSEDECESEVALDQWTTDATKERRMTDTPEKRRTPSASKVHEDGESFSEPRMTDAPADETDTADHGPQQTRLETNGSPEALETGMSLGMSVHVAVIEADLSPGRYSCDSPAAGLGESNGIHD